MTTATSAHDLAFDVADRMRRALRISGVSVGEMAEYLDVHRNSPTAWINGHTAPSTQTLRLWALRTGVPFQWLKDGVTPTDDGDDGRAWRDSNSQPSDP